jgi:nucleoside-diphosphate-sugar epimerase
MGAMVIQGWAITGGSGFIGQRLVKRVVSLKDVSLELFDPRRHSLFDPSTLKDLVADKEVIFHLAGRMEGDKEALKVNTLGTFNLLRAIQEFGREGVKLIFASSFAVYKPQKRIALIEEGFSTEPRSVYGWSKLLAEELIRHYVGLGKMKAVILRFSSVYGENCPPFRQSMVSTWADLINKNEELEVWGDGEQEKDLVSLDDAVEALIRAGDYQATIEEVFNICAGRGISVNKIIAALAAREGTVPRVKYLKKRGEEANEYWIGDNRKAQKLLGWRPKMRFRWGVSMS